MIIFNNSDILTSTGPIEITIDGLYVGTLRRREYLDADVSPGTHAFFVRHKESFIRVYYENAYTFEVTDPAATSIEVFTKLSSTGCRLAKSLPVRFERRFRRVEPPAAVEQPMVLCDVEDSDNPYQSPRPGGTP